MTVVMGLLCADGGILASDSQATDREAQIKHEVETKIYPLGTHIAWGLSGPIGLHQLCLESLNDCYKQSWATKDLSQIRLTLLNKVTGRQKEALAQHVPVLETIFKTAAPNLQSIVDSTPKAELLFCGFTHNKWLFEIASSGVHEQHSKFCAVGSGKITAYRVWSTLRHYTPHDDSIELGKFLAHRIVNDVITTDMAGVGFPIKMWTVTKEDGATELSKPEIDAQAITVQAWKDEERHSLRRTLEGKGKEALSL